MLSAPPEASSLSDITQLASNPPKYPRNPTEAKRAPLTLYIARVPGSKDIILTTLKPQLKNVTATDVSSSLYYLHLNTDDDIRLLKDEQNNIPEVVERPRDKPLARKPLPESSRSSLDSLGQAKLPLSSVDSPSVLTLPKRKPNQIETVLPEPPQAILRAEPTKPRRPLGPRPLLSDVAIRQSATPRIETASLRSSLDISDHSQRSGNSCESDRSFRSPVGERPVSENCTDEKPGPSFSITLIRRDPSSGAQWNIGTLIGHPVLGESQDNRPQNKHRTKRPYFDISVCLTTPGYGSFRTPRSAIYTAEGVTNSQNIVNDNGPVTEPRMQPFSISGFERYVQMEGSGFWSRSPIQHKKSPSEDLSKHGMIPGWTPSSSAAQSSGILPTSPRTSRDEVNPEGRGYVFLSPWGGRCKFSTGSGGRSLRCKHSLPAPVSSSTTAGIPSSQGVAALVSELRFNLPSSAIFTSQTTSTPAKKSGLDLIKPKFGHIRNKLSFQKERPVLPPRPESTSYAAMYPSDEDGAPPLPPRFSTYYGTDSSDDGYSSPERPSLPPRATRATSKQAIEDEDHLDLSIGREKAGGGNRGKRAKLGKLIIHDEGFKMLDLVIAANMGVWWSVWNFDNT